MNILRNTLAAMCLVAPSFAYSAPVAVTGGLIEGVVSYGAVDTTATLNGIDSSLVDYWYFQADAGLDYTVTGTRTDEGYDMAFWLFEGLINDDSVFGTTLSVDDPGFIALGDDEIDPPVGPFGDPQVTFTAASTSFYTLIVTNYLSAGDPGTDGLWDYSVVFGETPAPIPVPASLPLLAGSLAGLWGVRRARRNTA